MNKNWAVFGRFFQSLPVLCGASSHDFYFFREEGESEILRILIGGSEKEYIVILC